MTDGVEAEKRAALRDLFVCLGLRIVPDIREVSDAKAARVRAGRLEDIELIERALLAAGVRGVCKHRECGADLRLADHAEHLPLVGRHLFGTADFAERAPSFGGRFANETVDELIFRLRRDLWRIHHL